MSKNKKSRQKANPPPTQPEANKASTELTDEQLESVAGGASDIFAKLGDIKGESIDDKHQAEIELMSWSFGASQPSPTLKR